MEKSWAENLLENNYRPEIRNYLSELETKTLNKIKGCVARGQELRAEIGREMAEKDLIAYGLPVPNLGEKVDYDQELEEVIGKVQHLEVELGIIQKVKLQYENK